MQHIFTFFRVCPAKQRLSFANNKWVSSGPLLHKEKPFISPILAALLMSPCNPSIQSKNKKRDRGSLYLIPLEGYTKPLGSPLIKTE